MSTISAGRRFGGKAGGVGPSSRSRKSSRTRPVVLVVDDKESGRAALVGMLAGEPYEIVEAADGFEALEKAIQLRPDVVLLDVMLPGLDGFEVCRRVRANLDANSIPIVMVTVLDDRESRLAGLDARSEEHTSELQSH